MTGHWTIVSSRGRCSPTGRADVFTLGGAGGATLYDAIDERLRGFITAQPLFFAATAPESGGT
jgi:hypothetical protein